MMHHQRPIRASRIVLSLALTSVAAATVFPGAALPQLIQRWGLRDNQAGLLFFLCWSSSSIGNLTARGVPERFLFRGAVFLCLASVCLAYVASPLAALLFFALYGLGIGTATTSINRVQAMRSSSVGREMNRLSIFWAAGACICPLLVRRLVFGGSSTHLAFFLLAFLSATIALWTAVVELSEHASTVSRAFLASSHRRSRIPWSYAVLITSITGVETTTGGWIAVYQHRLQGSLAAGTMAVFYLWLGFFAGHALVAAGLLARWKDRTIVRAGAMLACLSVFGVVFGSSNTMILTAVLGIGLCAGPVHALLLGIAVKCYRGNLVFFMGGLGAAVFPWLTGVASSHFGSLHTGLMIVLVTVAIGMPIASWPAMQCVPKSEQDYIDILHL